MSVSITIPSMGESITEVKIVRFLVPEGAAVLEDAELVEIETDKVNQVLYAPRSGTVHWLIREGATIPIGAKIGEVMDGAATPIAPSGGHEVAAQPASASLRYTKEEFIQQLEKPSEPAAAVRSEPTDVPSSEKKETRFPLSSVRRVIAQRLVASQREMAILTTFNEVDLSAISALRAAHQAEFLEKHGCKLGWMSFFVKATVAALQEVPQLNSYLDGDEIVQRHTFDLGIAVGTERGVVVPVLRGCDQLKFFEIERAIAGFAGRAREGTLKLQELQGAGFTITNGGVYGSLLSTPLLVAPQCGILGMHKIEKRPVVVNDQICIRPMMYTALSYDHRLVDGKEAVTFLVALKKHLEDPARFFLEG